MDIQPIIAGSEGDQSTSTGATDGTAGEGRKDDELHGTLRSME